MARFDEQNNTARNTHISTCCKPANNGASERASRIGRALFHLDGLADVVDSDIRAKSGFVASCCRVIDRELQKTEPTTMTTHSPAPFAIGAEYSNSQDEIEDAEGRTVAVVWTRSAPERATARPQFKDVPHLKGNAMLFAASPKLLAACQSVLSSLEHHLAADFLPETRQVLRDAIIAATELETV